MQAINKTDQTIWFVLYWVAFWTVVVTVPLLVYDLLFYQTLWKQTFINGMIIGGVAGIVVGLARMATDQVDKGWVNDTICWGMAFIVGGAIISLVNATIVPVFILAGMGAVGGAVGGLVYPRFDAFHASHKALAIVFVFVLFAIIAAITPAYFAIL